MTRSEAETELRELAGQRGFAVHPVPGTGRFWLERDGQMEFGAPRNWCLDGLLERHLAGDIAQ